MVPSLQAREDSVRRRWVLSFAKDIARFRRTNLVDLSESKSAHATLGHLHPTMAVIEYLHARL